MVLPNTLTSYPLEHSGKHDRKQPSPVLSSQGRKKKTLRYHAAPHDDASLFQAFQTRSITSLYPGTETRYPFERQILAELSLSLTPTCVSKGTTTRIFKVQSRRAENHPRVSPSFLGITSGRNARPRKTKREMKFLFLPYVYILPHFTKIRQWLVKNLFGGFYRLKLPFWTTVNVVVEKLPHAGLIQLVHLVVIPPRSGSNFYIDFFVRRQNHFSILCRQTIREVF